ncbi:MAG: polysaccharide biosynthesis tyrosine autokinase [Planctomycetes bacterium]|nr:polysaccharide biosynthesis tyrosine autokinase [Planctomycetota bacterium]
MSASPAPKLLTLGDVVDLVSRRPLTSAIAGFGVMLLVLFMTSRTVPLFEASARLSVERGNKPVQWQVDPDTGKVEYSLLNTQKELLMSQVVLGEAVKTEAFNGDEVYTKSRDRVATLSHRVTATTSRDTWIISVALKNEDPVRAQSQLQAVIEAYLRGQDERESGHSRGALNFLSHQVTEANKRLEEARLTESRFRAEHGILSTDPDHNFLAEEVGNLGSKRSDFLAQLAASQALMGMVAKADEQKEPADRVINLLRIEPVRTNPVVIEQQRQLYDLIGKETALAQKYQDRHPRLLEIRSQITQGRKLLADAVEMARAGIANDHQKLTIQLDDVTSRIAQREKDLGKYRENLAELQALSGDTQSRANLYERLLTRKGEEEVSSHLNVQQIGVVDPSHSTSKPVNISRLKFLAIALVAGFAAALAVPLVFEGLDSRVRGAVAAQVLTRLPLLGKTPRIAHLAPLGREGDPERPHALAEAFRNLRASIRLARRQDAGCHCLMVTSSRPFEGKSTVAARLAVSLASTGAKVLLVDADLRKPTLHLQLGESGERGLSTALEGEKGVRMVQTTYQNLDFLGAGARPRNPGDLLHSPQLKELLFGWRQSYDYVIFDTPPLVPVSDAVIVGEVVDSIVLVVRDRFTTKTNIKAALARLAPLSQKISGVVLNGERAVEASYGYYSQVSARLPMAAPREGQLEPKSA